VRLDPDDIEAIARRVAELLASRKAPGEAVRYLDAAQLAELLGVERDWVYAHARQLSAIRLGGPHGRLRFDLHHVHRKLAIADAQQDRNAATTRPAYRGLTSRDGVELVPYAS